MLVVTMEVSYSLSAGGHYQSLCFGLGLRVGGVSLHWWWGVLLQTNSFTCVWHLFADDAGKKIYTSTLETLFYSWSGASMVPFALVFSKEMVYTIASGSGVRPREEGCHIGGDNSFSPMPCHFERRWWASPDALIQQALSCWLSEVRKRLSPNGWFWRMFLEPNTRNEGTRTGTRVQKPVFLNPQNRNEGTPKRNDGTKNRKECTFAKTALSQNRPCVSSQDLVSLFSSLSSPREGFPSGWANWGPGGEVSRLSRNLFSSEATCSETVSYDTALLGKNWKGQAKWDKRVSAKFCGFLQKSGNAVFCEDLRLWDAVISRKGENLQKISENLRKTANLAPFVPFGLSLLIPREVLEAKTSIWALRCSDFLLNCLYIIMGYSPWIRLYWRYGISGMHWEKGALCFSMAHKGSQC